MVGAFAVKALSGRGRCPVYGGGQTTKGTATERERSCDEAGTQASMLGSNFGSDFMGYAMEHRNSELGRRAAY